LSLNYRRLPTEFILEQDGMPAQDAQNRLQANCPDFITKYHWPPNLPNINPMDYHMWCAMLEAYCKLKTKPKTIANF